MQRTSRIEALDYLRGFFILVIIVDHLYRWPNLFEYVSGRGELWSSAAEGFVIISGLLVGYIRGYKNRSLPLSTVSRKVVLRGLMLYAWSIITTLLLVSLSWVLTFKSPIAFVPYSPFDWSNLLSDALTLHFAHSLTHFLYLYAVFLVLSPILLLLLRRGFWWLGIIASTGLWYYGYHTQVEWMQWQALFYIPAIAGYHLEAIIGYLHRTPRYVLWLVTGIGITTIIWSMMISLPMVPGTYHPPLFAREPLTFERIALSFLWFVALALLFQKILPWLQKSVSWLLLPLGTRSLTAYIAHAAPLMLIVAFVTPTTSFFVNTLLAVLAILTTWSIVRIPGINRIIPR